MTYEKILKREDGTQYKISITPRIDYYQRESIEYNYTIWYREKGKKTWLNIPDTLYDFQYRKLSMEEKEIHRKQNIYRFVTEAELYNAKIECWEKLKPPINK